MTNPSWGDFATHDESAYPELWDGVVGAWCPSLGPTGLRLHDHSRGMRWGTLTNMDAATDWLVTAGQYALDFDGVDDYISFSGNLFSGLSVVTVSMWAKPRTTTDRVEITQGTDSLNRCGGGLSEDGNAYGFSQLSGAITGFGYAPWSQLGVAQPIHVVLIYNSRGVNNAARSKVFLNGRQQTLTFSGTVSTSPISQGGTAFFGARPGPSSYSNGQADDITVWNRELSPNEIQQLYLLGRGGMYQRRRRTLRRVGVEQGAAGARRRRILTGMV